jgi:hypothetical protein
MNIFELIISEPQSYQQSDFANQQNNWRLFKLNIAALFAAKGSEVDQLMVKSKDFWAGVKRSSPELVPIMIEYYMSKTPFDLDEL